MRQPTTTHSEAPDWGESSKRRKFFASVSGGRLRQRRQGEQFDEATVSSTCSVGLRDPGACPISTESPPVVRALQVAGFLIDAAFAQRRQAVRAQVLVCAPKALIVTPQHHVLSEESEGSRLGRVEVFNECHWVPVLLPQELLS